MMQAKGTLVENASVAAGFPRLMCVHVFEESKGPRVYMGSVEVTVI